MRFWIFLLILAPNWLNFSDPDIEQVRWLSKKAPLDEAACETFIELLSPYDETDPLFYGYKGVATMIKAKHVINPFRRLSFFREGKAILNEAIESDPSNSELRFLRFSAQTQAPGFLGYRENIEEDKKFLILNFSEFEEEDFKKQIHAFLMKSEFITEQEKKRLEQLHRE